jgi:hypothetical protein
MILLKDFNYIWLNHQEHVSNIMDALREEVNKWQEMKLKNKLLKI